MSDAEFTARRLARQTWPGVKTTLQAGAEADELRATTTVEQRLSMMWSLAVNAWAMSGRRPPQQRIDHPHH